MSDSEDYDSNESEDEPELHVPKFPDDDSGGDSDRELQVAFKSGLLKPGLFRRITDPYPEINNEKGLLEKLDEIRQTELEWVERLDVTVEVRKNDEEDEEEEEVPEEDPDAEMDDSDVHNDFKREVMFQNQAKDSMLIAMEILHSDKVLTKRPEDYFAEMAKKDDHMKRVRQTILKIKQRRETIDKNKNNFQLRKYGKQVQQAVVKERQQKKRKMLNSVKQFRKGKTADLDFLNEPTGNVGKGKKTSQLDKLKQQKNLKPGVNAKRQNKDKKFGFGGRKKGSKYNTKESFDNVEAHGRKGGYKKQMRPGKSKRAKVKSQR